MGDRRFCIGYGWFRCVFSREVSEIKMKSLKDIEEKILELVSIENLKEELRIVKSEIFEVNQKQIILRRLINKKRRESK